MSFILPTIGGGIIAHQGSSFAYDLNSEFSIDVVPSVHLDASILDGSSSSNNPSDGSSVATWGDRSGNGNDFTEATNQPTFKESWLNGKPAVEFDGSNDVMSDSDFFTSVDFSAKDATMIIVYQPQNDSYYSLTDTGSFSGDDRTYSSAGLYSSSFLNTRINNGQYNEKYPAARSAATFGLRIDNSATSYKIYYNNREQFDHTSYATSDFQTTGGAMKIGCGDSTYKLDGFISEVLVFNTVLSDTDFNTIHSYIDSKYRIHQYNNVTGSYALNGSYSTTVTPVMHFSAQSNLFKSDGSTPTNGEEVYRWTDKARGYHAIANNAPVLNTNQINTSLNGIYFDGTDDFMDVFMLGILGDFSDFDGTAIVLFEPNTDSVYEPVGIGGSNSGRLYNGSSTTYVDVFRNARINGAATTGYFANTGVQLAAIVSNATSNTYEIFKDGGSDVFDSAQTASALATLFNDNKNMRLGATTATPAHHLKGWIYEVLVFDSPLSTSDLDVVGNYISSVYGTTYTNITPFNSFSLSFDGANDRLEGSANSNINFSGNLSVSAWVRQDTLAHGGILAVGEESADGSTYPGMFHVHTSPTKLQFVAQDSTGSAVTIKTATTPTVNQWVHILVSVQSGVTNGTNIYLNGSLDKTATTFINAATGTVKVFIGKKSYSGNHIDGFIDEVAMFNSALSATDATNIYNSGTPNDLGTNGLNLNPVAWWRMGDNDLGTGTTITDQGSGGNNVSLINTDGSGPTFSSTVP